jgi:plasmid stability protein
MAQLSLNIDERLMRSVELRAETLGQSVEATINELLDIGLHRDVRGRVAIADRIRAMTPQPIDEDSTDIIRRMRDGT